MNGLVQTDNLGNIGRQRALAGNVIVPIAMYYA